MGAAACNLRSAGREQPGLAGRRFALIRPRTAVPKESLSEAARERQSQSQHRSWCTPQHCTSIVHETPASAVPQCHLPTPQMPRSYIPLPSHRHGVQGTLCVCVVHAYAAQSQHPRPIATDRSRWHDGTSRLCSRNTTRGPCREHDTTMRYPQALHSAVVPLHRCRLVTIHTQELKAC